MHLKFGSNKKSTAIINFYRSLFNEITFKYNLAKILCPFRDVRFTECSRVRSDGGNRNRSGQETSSLSATEQKLTQGITIDSIKKYTNALASDEMEGRGTMQPGGDKAANWIAGQFKSLGLKPLGDKDSYLQSIKFKETVFTPETAFEVGEDKFKMGKDYGFIPLPFKKENADVNAEMVFIGYGMELFSKKSDILSKIKGKIVVMIEGPPASVPKKEWEEKNVSIAMFQGLVANGVKAIITIGNGREGDKSEEYIDYFGRRQIALADEQDSPAPFPIPPLMMVNRATAQKLFAKSDVEFTKAMADAEYNTFNFFELKNSAKIVTKYETKKGTSSNVVGYIEGSDPKLKNEAVLFSAHYDAYGVENGKIYNGAADNALGTAEMLAVAESFSKMSEKPKRSLIFIAVTGEEYGLYGSKYWANEPTWDIKKVAANLNLDGIGTEVFGPVKNMVGFGAEYSTLGAMLDDVAKSYGIKIMPDPQPEEKVFTRSDHYSFVKRGVPALMLMGAPEGTKEELIAKIKSWEKVNYHQPTDDVMENWDWTGAKTVADMMGVLGLRIANQEKMPEWLKGTRFGDLKRGNTKDIPEEDEN